LIKKVLAGRFRWLLAEMMRKQGIDVQEIDSEISFWENKAEIERKYCTVLVLKMENYEEAWLRQRVDVEAMEL